MIEALIWAIAIGMMLIFCLLAYVLYAEVNKQKRPSYRKPASRKIFHPEYLTPEQLRLVSSPYPTLFFGSGVIIFIYKYGFGHLLTWLAIGMASLALFEWLALGRGAGGNSDVEASSGDDLQRQLVRLVGGDRETAHRLAALEGGNWQAAIDKLIRDRR
jgi:hypothetical protein